jgi:hypothetical protein
MKLSRMPINFFIVGFVFLLIALFFLLGIRYLPMPHAPIINFQVNAEYTNGILTASSILYGMWGFVFASKPNQRDIDEAKENDDDAISAKEFLKLRLYSFKTVIRTVFLIGFILLVVNVFFIVLVSIGIYSEGMALIITAFTFLLNAYFLWLTLDNYVFK